MIIGSKIEKHDILPSTNEYATQLLAQEDVIEGTVIVAKYQTAGKGQGLHTWDSDDGKNLLFSIILYPDRVLPEDQIFITMAVSLGVCDFLNDFFKGSQIKAHKDIYYNNHKIAGILIENTIVEGIINSCVVGIGLNVNQTTFPSNLPNPISIANITGREQNTEDCLNKLLVCLDKRYKELLYGDREKIKSDYTKRLIAKSM
ncbi:MAG: biotin--[acetyl-CoA-carboxylase] ligase [Bacteroidales bacterium]|nr:biotin--[acetyl-CoA-carboxylase] ligase [Bacteroidales bacterium]